MAKARKSVVKSAVKRSVMVNFEMERGRYLRFKRLAHLRGRSVRWYLVGAVNEVLDGKRGRGQKREADGSGDLLEQGQKHKGKARDLVL
jgi:hypothetical protein